MKKIIAVLSIMALAVVAQAQTNTPPNVFTNPPPTISGGLGEIWGAVKDSPLLTATNYAVAPYATYAPGIKAKDKFGGGVLAVYNVNNYVGGAIGVDWLGQFSLISANAELKYDTQPFSAFAWAPSWLTNVTVTPLGIVGVGTPFGGTASSGAATLWDVGAQATFGHLWGGRFGVGYTYGAWNNAGDYSGNRDHIFVSWRKGF